MTPAPEAWRREIEDAYRLIEARIRKTPAFALPRPEAYGAGEIILKLESMQYAGSFKCRGAFNALLSRNIPECGVIAASGGNHGAAVAYAASRVGCAAEIYVPTISSPVKIARIRQYGAKVTVIGANYADALAASLVRARQTAALSIHAYDEPAVIAGQGTIGLEIEAQAGPFDTIIVPVGGGGLLAGLLGWFGHRTKIVGVEPELAPTMTRALETGSPLDVSIGGVAADSLGARRAGSLAFDLARSLIAQMVLVGDREILDAQRFLWSSLRIVAEPGAVVGLAALRSGRLSLSDEKVGLIISGGNADPSELAAV